jgi:hypothetical protein
VIIALLQVLIALGKARIEHWPFVVSDNKRTEVAYAIWYRLGMLLVVVDLILASSVAAQLAHWSSPVIANSREAAASATVTRFLHVGRDSMSDSRKTMPARGLIAIA